MIKIHRFLLWKQNPLFGNPDYRRPPKGGLSLTGFTLTEIMIVVGIILLLASISIPRLLRARITAQESTATASLRAILSAEIQYRSVNTGYADLPTLNLDIPPYIDATLSAGNKEGYNFIATPGGNDDFYATAAPQNLMQANTFYIDENGILCRSDNLNTPAPGAHANGGCPAGFSEPQ